MKKNLIFIGMPAVGKSTVGIVVAKRLGMKFIDTDLLIQEQEGKLLREIIAECGEDGFLEIENRVNASVRAENSVISPGGSVIYCREAMEHYKKIGTVVYLQASYQTIRKRIRNPKKRGVVLREGQTLRDLYDERVPYFEKYADITVCEDGCQIEDTIENVLAAVKECRKRQRPAYRKRPGFARGRDPRKGSQKEAHRRGGDRNKSVKKGRKPGTERTGK